MRRVSAVGDETPAGNTLPWSRRRPQADPLEGRDRARLSRSMADEVATGRLPVQRAEPDQLHSRLAMYSAWYELETAACSLLPLRSSVTSVDLTITRLAVDMKFPIRIHIHRRLSCLHVATKFPQSTAGAKGGPSDHPPKTKTQTFAF